MQGAVASAKIGFLPYRGIYPGALSQATRGVYGARVTQQQPEAVSAPVE